MATCSTVWRISGSKVRQARTCSDARRPCGCWVPERASILMCAGVAQSRSITGAWWSSGHRPCPLRDRRARRSPESPRRSGRSARSLRGRTVLTVASTGSGLVLAWPVSRPGLGSCVYRLPRRRRPRGMTGWKASMMAGGSEPCWSNALPVGISHSGKSSMHTY